MLINKAEAIKSLYSQRDKFILIGLTGRTGSGCTTVANILSKDNIKLVIIIIQMKENIVLFIDI